jgi:hypothetical protein
VASIDAARAKTNKSKRRVNALISATLTPAVLQLAKV